jgi:hypothetical protein
MAYSVKFAGEDRPLRFRLEDREWVEEQFPRADGTPGSLNQLVAGHLGVVGGSLKVQATITAAGLRHLGKEWTVDKVKAEIADLIASGGDVRLMVSEVLKAMCADGVLGRVIDLGDDSGKK